MSKLDKALAHIDEYDEYSKNLLKSLSFTDRQVSDITSMKSSAGWKVVEARIRQELEQRMFALVKDDPEIKTLLILLNVADTKTIKQALEEEIEKAIPETG